jgi:Fe-S cluster biogenesis protein NfuA
MADETLLHTTPPGRDDVEAILDRLRPGLIADGGNVELAGIDPDGTVRVEMQGECARCPAQLATIRVAIEEPLRRAHPGVTAVLAV